MHGLVKVSRRSPETEGAGVSVSDECVPSVCRFQCLQETAKVVVKPLWIGMTPSRSPAPNSTFIYPLHVMFCSMQLLGFPLGQASETNEADRTIEAEGSRLSRWTRKSQT